MDIDPPSSEPPPLILQCNGHPLTTMNESQTANNGDQNSSSKSNSKKRKADQITPPADTSKKFLEPGFKGRTELERLSYSQLVELVLRHQRARDPEKALDVEQNRRINQKGRDIDWDKYSLRHVAFKVVYLGWDYAGLVTQLSTSKTIEYHLFDAMKKVKLIKDEFSCDWSRAGRTDKGVSALCQVISCNVRSNVKEGLGLIKVGNGVREGGDEMDFIAMINGALPDEIRVIGWTPVDVAFNARFTAISRTYKYFFVKEDMDIDAMRNAASYLIGEHDFRNFCKMDIGNVLHFKRSVLNISINPVHNFPNFLPNIQHPPNASPTDPNNLHPYKLWEITIMGSAFLWHQIRFTMAVLFMVGRREEAPEIVKELLDISKYPNKPVFQMESEIPLILWDVGYFGIEFSVDINSQRRLQQHFYDFWKKKAIMAQMSQLVVASLDNSIIEFSARKATHDYENVRIQHNFEVSSSASTSINQEVSPSTSTPSVPTLRARNHAPGVIPDNKSAAKDLLWATEDGAIPVGLQWGQIRDQVMEFHHQRHYHLPVAEMAVEQSFEERMAKRPKRASSLAEIPSSSSNIDMMDDGNE